MRIRNIVVNSVGFLLAATFSLTVFFCGVATWQEAIGWFIGLFGLVWCSFTDMRVKLAPDRYLNLLIFAPIVTSILYLISSQNLFSGMVQGLFHLQGMALSAGGIWALRILFSALFRKEALGEADIYPCALVGGLTGSGFAGILTFFVTPFIMFPIICWCCFRHRKSTLPLLPALLISTFIVIPLSQWIQHNIFLLN